MEQNKATFAPQLSGVSVYAAGDIADCRRVPPQDSGAAVTAALLENELAKDSRSIVLTLGDSTYPNGAPAEFAGCYEPTWGRFKNRTYPIPGNHEYKTPAASGYFQYFGSAARPEQGGYYSFDINGWHIIALNSNLQGQDFSAQLAWLKSDLEQNKRRCTLAYWHHPVVSSGGHGDNEAMRPAWQMLAQANVELVLAAHDHHYERSVPMDGSGQRDDASGIRQFIVGTGGARLTLIRPFTKHSAASSNESHGVLKLVLMKESYAWQFVATEPEINADQGMDTCH